MDSTTLVNVVVIASFVIVIILIYHNVRASKRHLAGDSRQEQAFRNWLRHHGYAAADFHFYRGTGIAYGNDNEKMACFSNGSPAFHGKNEIEDIKSHEEISGRMVAAAPGVVRQVNTTLYVLEISLKNNVLPAYKIVFSDSDQRSAWRARLRGEAQANAD